EQSHYLETQNKKSTPTGMIIALVAVVAVAAFFAGSYFSSMDSDAVTRSELQQAISRLESKMESNQPTPQQAPQPVRISLDDDPIRGDPDAPITIIEFSDFQCPFCARFHEQTLPSLLEEYIDEGKVNFVYRDFPIQSIHPNALPAAVAAECADDQGKYWEYHDILFEKQSSWARLDSNSAISTFSQYATDVGLEKEQFDSCLGSGKHLEEVQGDLRDGRDYDITGTPGFFIGNDEIGFVKLNGAQPFESFKRVIDAQQKHKKNNKRLLDLKCALLIIGIMTSRQ
ncbi:MAG: DsbA family protein, partial [Candidatus Nitrosomaritimum aestuariumsis]